MKSVRRGLRDDELEKDTYGRVACAACEQTLKREEDIDEVYDLRVCPECATEWKDLR